MYIHLVYNIIITSITTIIVHVYYHNSYLMRRWQQYRDRRLRGERRIGSACSVCVCVCLCVTVTVQASISGDAGQGWAGNCRAGMSAGMNWKLQG